MFHQMFYDASCIDKSQTRQLGGRSSRYRALTIPPLSKCRDMMEENYPGSVGNDVGGDDDLMDTPIERNDDMEEF